MMKFEQLDLYYKEQAEQEQSFNQLVEREEKAKENLTKLKHEYETLLKKSLLSGKDESQKLDDLSNQIEQAQKSFINRNNERNSFSSLLKRKYTSDKLQADFKAYKKEFEEKEALPKLEAVLEAKKQLTRAFFDYIKVYDFYESEKQAVISELNWEYDFFGKIGPETTAEFEKWFVTTQTIQDLQNERLPAGVTEADLKGVK